MPLFSLRLDHVAHDALRRALPRGGCAVDATAGNGHDTLFLATCAGPEGRVWAFDVQAAALEATRQRLAAATDAAPVTLVHDGHENLARHLPAEACIHAATFNLGYLPGSDKHIATQYGTTLAALRQLLSRMMPEGIIAIHAYTGHKGGNEELCALMHFAQQLPYNEWQVLHTETANKCLRPEHIFLLQQRS